MSYVFQPLSDDQLDSINLMDDGIYDFQVIRATRAISENNNLVAKLQLTVWDIQGNEHRVFDNLTFSKVPLNIKKIKHFCDSVGLVEQYKKGELPEDLEKLSGKVSIGRQDKQPKEGGGFYPAKNIVFDYILAENRETKNSLTPALEKFLDEDLPF